MTKTFFAALAAEIRKIEDQTTRSQAASVVGRVVARLNIKIDLARFYAMCDVL